MQGLEKISFSNSKVDRACESDDGLCRWNETNFLKLLYFLWQDSSRAPHLTSVFIHLLNQGTPLTLVAVHKKPGLRHEYNLPMTSSSNLGVPAYLVLSVSDPTNHHSLQGLFPSTGGIHIHPSIFLVDKRGYLLHRPMSWHNPLSAETHQTRDGANSTLLRTVQSELGVTTLEQAFVTLATHLQERLLASEVEGGK